MRHHQLLAVRHQVGEDITPGGGADHRAGGYWQLDVGSTCAGLVCAPTVLTPFGPYQTPIVEMEEGVETFVDDEDYAPTAPPVTAVRPAPWHEFLASE
jgi:hypothetical protein